MRTLIAAFATATLLAAQPLPVSSPEREGLSPERLERLHKAFRQMTEERKRAGAISMIVRNGKIADWQTYGFRDAEAQLPMEKDTICRIWSMSKVVTSVAALMLMEEGKLSLNDPVDKFFPELKSLKVLQGGTADNPQLGDATRPITIKQLLTHTSGLTYGFTNDLAAQLYRRAKVFEVGSLKEFIGKVALVPLVAQPGDKYEYGISTDVVGAVVEAVADMPFDRFVKTRITDPLKMEDTFFELPAEKRSRLAQTYTTKEGRMVEQESDSLVKLGTVPFGGMGLYSTIGDYARFAQMLLNGGQLDGARLLSRKTVELMTANHLNHMPRQTIAGSESDGFGLGGAVRIDLAKGNRLGSLGTFGWDGAASTHFRIDPKERTVALLFMQYMPFDGSTIEKFSNLFYQAIMD